MIFPSLWHLHLGNGSNTPNVRRVTNVALEIATSCLRFPGLTHIRIPRHDWAHLQSGDFGDGYQRLSALVITLEDTNGMLILG